MILTHGHYQATPDSKDYGQPGTKAKAANHQHSADMAAYMDNRTKCQMTMVSIGRCPDANGC